MLLAICSRTVFWGRLRINLSRSLLLFLKIISPWMNHLLQELWMFSDLQLDLQLLCLTQLLNCTHCFMMYYLPRHRTNCIATSRYGTEKLKMPFLFLLILTCITWFDNCFRLLLRRDQEDTWLRQMNTLVAAMKGFWWMLLLFPLLIRKWNHFAWISEMKSLQILRFTIKTSFPG